MRIRTAVAGLVAMVATVFGAQSPSMAASGGDVHMQINFNCLGCGTTSNNWTAWWCYGVCIIDGNVCVGACHYYGSSSVSSSGSPNCLASGTASGTINFPTGAKSFNLTWVGATWVMSSSIGTASGTWGVTDPVGNPCGGPAVGTFVGALAGP